MNLRDHLFLRPFTHRESGDIHLLTVRMGRHTSDIDGERDGGRDRDRQRDRQRYMKTQKQKHIDRWKRNENSTGESLH